MAGVLELSYQRAAERDSKGLAALVGGLIVAGAAFAGLLATDGVGVNFVFGLLVGAGILVAVIGWGVWRYDPLRRKGAFQVDPGAGRLVALGLASRGSGRGHRRRVQRRLPDRGRHPAQQRVRPVVFMIGLAVAGVLAVLVVAGKLPVWSPLAGIAISAVPTIGFLMTRQTARAVLFVALAVAGLIILVLASNRAAPRSASAGLAIELLTAGVVVLLAFFVRSEATSEKFRTQLFTVMLLIGLALACSALMGYLFARPPARSRTPRPRSWAAGRPSADSCS